MNLVYSTQEVKTRQNEIWILQRELSGGVRAEDVSSA